MVRVLISNKVNYWTGEECRAFEQEFAAWTGAAHAVALANGTLALDVVLKAMGIGPGDEVIVTPRTFIASVSCVVNAGATPVFADVEPDSGNLSASTIARVITPRTRAVICVHLAGWPCDMDPIMALAAEHGIKVIEDCAQAHGARYKAGPSALSAMPAPGPSARTRSCPRVAKAAWSRRTTRTCGAPSGNTRTMQEPRSGVRAPAPTGLSLAA